MALVHHEALPARRRAPVDRADSVAGYEVADVRVLDPSPFVRATSLPASAWVRRGRWTVTGLGYALRRRRSSKPASHVTSRSASRARTSTRPTSNTPQRAHRRQARLRLSPARRRSACASEPSATSMPRGRRRRTSSRSIVRSVRTATTASTTAPSSVRSCARSTATELRLACDARAGARSRANGAATTASSGRRRARAAPGPTVARRVAEEAAGWRSASRVRRRRDVLGARRRNGVSSTSRGRPRTRRAEPRARAEGRGGVQARAPRVALTSSGRT